MSVDGRARDIGRDRRRAHERRRRGRASSRSRSSRLCSEQDGYEGVLRAALAARARRSCSPSGTTEEAADAGLAGGPASTRSRSRSSSTHLPLAAGARDLRRRRRRRAGARRRLGGVDDKLFGIPIGELAVVLVVAARCSRSCAVAVLALRNRVFFRLGVRNARRRRGRSALIVVGLMLGTAIIAAALATGDTMSHTIRSSAVPRSARPTRSSPRKASTPRSPPSGGGDRRRATSREGYADRVARGRAAPALVDGVAPVIVEPIAVQDVDEPPERAAGDALRERPGAAARLRRRSAPTAGPSRSPTCGPARST